MKIRGCPRSITRTTELNPATAPTLIRGARTFLAKLLSIESTPTAIGSGTPSFVYETIPVRTSATRIYKTVQIASEPRIPIGRSR